jgi:hypothetical protein
MSDQRTNLVIKAASSSLLGRREFLAGLLTLGGGVLVSACQVREQDQISQRIGRPRVMASPQAVTAAEATPATGEAGSLSLEQFLALSAVLTGFNQLNPELGQVYLASLQTHPELELTPRDLYEQIEFDLESPPTLEAITETGVFEDEQLRPVADKILEYWYTGIYERDGEQVVATTVDSLTWKAMTFTPPLTICGPGPGFWAEEPDVDPIPPAEWADIGQSGAG